MRNTREETLEEHAAETAMLAHALASIGNELFGRHYNADRAVTLALFHDATEVYTGDMPTPVKYYTPRYERAIRGSKPRQLAGSAPLCRPSCSRYTSLLYAVMQRERTAMIG